MGFTNLQIKLTVNKDQEVQKYLFKNTNKKKRQGLTSGIPERVQRVGHCPQPGLPPFLVPQCYLAALAYLGDNYFIYF